MYRADDGSKKFSFTRFMTNAVPNIAGAPQDTDLSPHEQDLVFTAQLGCSDPLVLDSLAFQHAGITASPKTSAAIHKALLKNGVLEPGKPAPNTGAITSNFAHELSIITSHAQKKLVNLLFFWEEEVQRWNVLIGELEELKVVIQAEKESGGAVGTYEKRLAEVEGGMRVRPSLRGQEKREEELPAYGGK
jgi:hypothetical protein